MVISLRTSSEEHDDRDVGGDLAQRRDGVGAAHAGQARSPSRQTTLQLPPKRTGGAAVKLTPQ
jgi:hypothetical protein